MQTCKCMFTDMFVPIEQMIYMLSILIHVYVLEQNRLFASAVCILVNGMSRMMWGMHANVLDTVGYPYPFHGCVKTNIEDNKHGMQLSYQGNRQ